MRARLSCVSQRAKVFSAEPVRAGCSARATTRCGAARAGKGRGADLTVGAGRDVVQGAWLSEALRARREGAWLSEALRARRDALVPRGDRARRLRPLRGRRPPKRKNPPLVAVGFFVSSGREDSNLRPLGPEPSALPGCATPRLFQTHTFVNRASRGARSPRPPGRVSSGERAAENEGRGASCQDDFNRALSMRKRARGRLGKDPPPGRSPRAGRWAPRGPC